MGIFRDLGVWFTNLIGVKDLSFDAMYIGIALVALILLIVVLIIVAIVKCAKKGKKKKAQTVKVSNENLPAENVVKQEKVETVTEIEEKEQDVSEKTVEVVPEKIAQEEVAEEKVSKPKTTKKSATKKPEVKKETKKLNGKWVVELKSAGEYMSKLLASNGEVMLSSEIYTTEEGARNGIASILRGVENGKFVIYQDKNKNYYYKLKTTTNRLLCVGEIYKSKDQCYKAVESVKRIASSSPIANGLVEGQKYAEYTPAVIDTENKLRGKWRIEKTEQGKYSAKLYANNGQLMLATEEVSLEKSAKNAIESVKKNSLEGNFIIDHDKFGRYYYKLRNAQKSVICIGEAYDKLESCVSAIESVRRFAQNSSLVED